MRLFFPPVFNRIKIQCRKLTASRWTRWWPSTIRRRWSRRNCWRRPSRNEGRQRDTRSFTDGKKINQCCVSPLRENNCQELKKETEDKIQTLVTDHKTKVMQNPDAASSSSARHSCAISSLRSSHKCFQSTFECVSLLGEGHHRTAH